MFQVTIKDATGFSAEAIKKLVVSLDLWERAWNTEEFKQRIINYSYKATYTTGKLWWKKTYTQAENGFYFAPGEDKFTNEQVYEKLMVEKTFNIVLKNPINPFTSAVAYTDFNSKTVYLYKKYFWNASQERLANTLSHEIGCHLSGFSHTFNYTKLRDYSVPYAVGDITEEIAMKLL